MLPISKYAVLILQNEEGLKLTPYLDDSPSTPNVTEYSIGRGHQIKPNEQYLMQGITHAKADQLFEQDVIDKYNAVKSLFPTNLFSNFNQNQIDALFLFAYNAGQGSLKNSNFFKLILSGGSEEAIKAAWQAYPYNKSRRLFESNLFFFPISADKTSKAAIILLVLLLGFAFFWVYTQL